MSSAMQLSHKASGLMDVISPATSPVGFAVGAAAVGSLPRLFRVAMQAPRYTPRPRDAIGERERTWTTGQPRVSRGARSVPIRREVTVSLETIVPTTPTTAMRWAIDFYNHRRAIVVRYEVDAASPAAAVAAGQQARLAQYPAPPP